MVSGNNSIYTIVSNDKLHIAQGAKHVGSVNTYTCCLTQFFTWLFGISMIVDFDGKSRYVNTVDYTNLVKDLTRLETINDIAQHTIFRSVLRGVRLAEDAPKMRQIINRSDAQALSYKLARSISIGDTEKAMLMIGMGANLDMIYFDRGRDDVSFENDSDDLPRNTAFTVTVFKGTPILQAARKGYKNVCQFLKEAGAGAGTAKQYTLERKITKVETRREMVYKPVEVPEAVEITDPSTGLPAIRYVNHVESRLHFVTRTYVTTQDSRSDEKYFDLNETYDLIQSRFRAV